MQNTDLDIKKIFSLAYDNHQKNNLELAESLYKKILKLNAQHFEAIFLLGTLYLQKRNFDIAKEYLNKALKIKPEHAHAHHNLGYAYMETGKPIEAKEIFNKVIRIQPNHADAHYNLGNIYKHLGEFKKAEEYFKKTIKILPNHSAAYNNLGNVLKDAGKFEDAVLAYNKAIQIQSNHPNAYHNLGNTYKQLGDFKKSINFYHQSIKHQPNNLETYFALSELDKTILDSKLEKKISLAVEKNKLSKRNEAYGNFLLAKYENVNQNFEQEFNYLLKGHATYFEFKKNSFEKGVNYFLKELPKNEELMILGKSNENIEKIKPIFIVGVPRCGSTLIEKVIASGKNSIPIGEETAIVSLFVGQKIAEKKSLILEVENIKEKIINRYRERELIKEKNNYIFTDKSLDNFFFIGLIKEIFPQAKIINCSRKPISSIMSIIKNNLGDVAWAHNLENIFNFFDIYYQKIDYFKKLYSNFIYDLKFEKFVENPEIESKKLMEFCELSWDKKCLEFYKRKDITSRTASNIQIRKAIYKDPKDKHAVYKQFLDKYGNKYSWYN